MKHHSKSDKTSSAIKGTAIGIVVSILVMLVGISIISVMVVNENVAVSSITIALYLLMAVSTYGGVYVSCKLIRSRHWVMCVTHVSVLFAIMVGMHVAASGGKYVGIIQNVLSILTGAICALLTVRVSQKTRRKMKNR